MRAIAIDDFGAPATLHDLAVPEPGRVRFGSIEASSIHGFDRAVAEGWTKDVIVHASH